MNLSGVWDWAFFWNSFGYMLKTIAPFLMLAVAIIATGMLLSGVVSAIWSKKNNS